MKKIENDLITKRMNFYSKYKYPCINCGRKMPIRYDRKSVICSWCHHLIFRTEKEYYDYYNKKSFKEEFRKARSKIENNQNTVNN